MCYHVDGDIYPSQDPGSMSSSLTNHRSSQQISSVLSFTYIMIVVPDVGASSSVNKEFCCVHTTSISSQVQGSVLVKEQP